MDALLSMQGVLAGAAAYVGTKAGQLDGVDEYINLGAVFSGTSSGDPFTIAFWFKTPTVTDNDFILGGNSTVTCPSAQVTAGYLYVRSELGNRRTASAVSTNTWYHVVYRSTSAAASPTIYLNGAASNGTTGGIAPTRIAEDLNLGRGAGYYFNGTVCDLAIWTGEAISDAEAVEAYNAGARFDMRTMSNPPDHWWPFGAADDMTGTTGNIDDKIGAMDGTPYNTESGDLVAGP